MTILLVVGFFIAIQAASNPSGTLATVTSFVPGLSPMVMPVRMAGGGAAWWEVLLAVVLHARGHRRWWCGSAAASTPAPCCAPAARPSSARRCGPSAL